MAKARKRTTIADSESPQSSWDDWMPLEAASAHIQQVIGGHQLATEDLRLRLASGDVEAHERRLIPGGGIEVIPLTPEDFKEGDALSDDLGPLLRIFPFRGRDIFLRRADVNRIWPMRLADPASPPHQPPSNQLPTKRPKGVGPRAWLVAREVDALMREGGKGSKWIDLDYLLKTIRERIGAKDSTVLSLRTLVTALAYLRINGLIDR
jgi:hypothetical protein